MSVANRQSSAGNQPSSADSQPAARPPEIPEAFARRVVVEAVHPEIDGGRFPIKRTAGERVEVTATIFADGHDVVAAVVRDRPGTAEAVPYEDVPDDLRRGIPNEAGTALPCEWRETPMTWMPPARIGGARGSSLTSLACTSIRSSPGSIAS